MGITNFLTQLWRACDSSGDGEERRISLGMLRGYVVVVVWTDRGDDVMRIISMRRGNARERKAYEGI